MQKCICLLFFFVSISLYAGDKPAFTYSIPRHTVKFLTTKKYSNEVMEKKYKRLTRYTDFQDFARFWNGNGPLNDLLPATVYMFLNAANQDDTYRKIAYNIIKANGYAFPYFDQSRFILPILADYPNILPDSDRYMLLAFWNEAYSRVSVDVKERSENNLSVKVHYSEGLEDEKNLDLIRYTLPFTSITINGLPKMSGDSWGHFRYTLKIKPEIKILSKIVGESDSSYKSKIQSIFDSNDPFVVRKNIITEIERLSMSYDNGPTVLLFQEELNKKPELIDRDVFFKDVLSS